MENNCIISIKNLTKFHTGAENPAIKDLSLSIAQNDFFGLLGPNGAGKTTTLSILCGLYPPTSGEVIIDGLNLKNNIKKIKSIIGVVPQELALYPSLTANENLRFFGNMYGMSGQPLQKMIREELKRFELTSIADKRIETYSGGMKRRINLIAGILHQPKILFLDEPTTGIDIQSRKMITEYLKKLNQTGTTIIYTSHYIEETENLCNKIAILDEGIIIAHGDHVDLIKTTEVKNLEELFLLLTEKSVYE